MLYDVVVPAPVPRLTYRVPEALAALVVPGRRVLVPLGSRRLTGVAVGPSPESADGAGAREILRVLDDGPLVTPDVLALTLWAADYYLCPPGLAVRAALPPGIEVAEQRALRLTEAGHLALGGGTVPASVRRELAAVEAGVAISLPVNKRLVAGGLAEEVAIAISPRVNSPTVEFAGPAPDAASRVAELSRTPAQARVLEWLLARGRSPVEELAAAFPHARAALKKLTARGFASIESAPAGPLREASPWDTARRHALNPHQQAALTAIAGALGAFTPFLLHGVTGSGKTEVYLGAIEATLARGLCALTLVPEIALTPQLAGRFRARFGDEVAVLHSGLTPSERLGEWRRVSSGRARVVVGARSAVFAPIAKLGLVVVDEEHEPSFKQEEAPRYNGRDLAVKRASLCGAVVVLGSATPALETLHNARAGRYRLLRLPERVDGRGLPAVLLVSLAGMKRVREPEAKTGLFTQELGSALNDTLARGEQSILFLNRRGHSTFVLCFSCGAAVRCPQCDLSLTHHEGARKLVCHTCGHTQPTPTACPACASTEVALLGAGTEKVEQEVRALFPSARVLRLDRDTASARGATASVLAAFARREADILIGTQMIAKGHDFPGVTLVGILCADAALNIPDFRAAERCFQLVAQVSGRAGRGEAPGSVVLQAFDVTSPAVRCAEHHDYDTFANTELADREALRYPPFARLCLLRFEGESASATEAVARRLASAASRAALARGGDVEVLGPAPAAVARLRNRYRWQALLKARSHGPLAEVARAVLSEKVAGDVRVVADIDPASLL